MLLLLSEISWFWYLNGSLNEYSLGCCGRGAFYKCGSSRFVPHFFVTFVFKNIGHYSTKVIRWSHFLPRTISSLKPSLIRLAPWMAKCYQWTYNLLSYGSQSIERASSMMYMASCYLPPSDILWELFVAPIRYFLWNMTPKIINVLRLLKRFWWIVHLNSKQEAALWSSRSWIVPTHPLLMNFHLSNFDIENLHTAPDGRLHSGPIEKQSSKLSLTHCMVFLL